jgi:hypothetical protein
MKKQNLGNTLVIAITFILFLIALFTTGFKKDLLLEAGVFLVSIKLIMMNRSTANSNKEIIYRLNEINKHLQDIKSNEPR